MIVACELALATVLLVSAGLLTRSVGEIAGTDPGIEVGGLIAMSIRPQETTTDAEWHALLQPSREVQAALERVPGVTAVTGTRQLPFLQTPGSWSTTLAVGGEEIRGTSALRWLVDTNFQSVM